MLNKCIKIFCVHLPCNEANEAKNERGEEIIDLGKFGNFSHNFSSFDCFVLSSMNEKKKKRE